MADSCKPTDGDTTGDGSAKSAGCRGRCGLYQTPSTEPNALSAAGHPRKPHYEHAARYGEAPHQRCRAP